MTDLDHCVVVPAYGDSPHLHACLQSLADQHHRSAIIVATPTPSSFIQAAADRFGARVCINSVRGGIGADWNFALSCASTRWVTIAHQDDIYLPAFVSSSLGAACANPDAVLVFTGYAERLEDDDEADSTLLRIKRVLLESAFLGGGRAASTFFKTNALRFGCAIPCPSVTVDVARTHLRFREDLRVDLDWAAWLDLARAPGAFVYVRQRLMLHRVHRDSETSAGIAGGERAAEDRMLLRKMWPRIIADMIAGTYGIAYRSNKR